MASFVPSREWTLKFPEEGPLGMKLDVVKRQNANAVESLSTVQVSVCVCCILKSLCLFSRRLEDDWTQSCLL